MLSIAACDVTGPHTPHVWNNDGAPYWCDGLRYTPCGSPHPDEPRTTCTYPLGHGPVQVDPLDDPGHVMQHGAPAVGAWWSVEQVDPATLTPTATAARVRAAVAKLRDNPRHGGTVGEPGAWISLYDLERLLDYVDAQTGAHLDRRGAE